MQTPGVEVRNALFGMAEPQLDQILPTFSCWAAHPHYAAYSRRIGLELPGARVATGGDKTFTTGSVTVRVASASNRM
jgi:hypothetical protein